MGDDQEKREELARLEAQYKLLKGSGGLAASGFPEWYALHQSLSPGEISGARRGLAEEAAERTRQRMLSGLRAPDPAMTPEERAKAAQAKAAEDAPGRALVQGAYELARRGAGAAVNPLEAFSGDPTKSLRTGLGVSPGTVGATLQQHNLLPKDVENPPPPPGQPAKRQPVVGDRSGELLAGSMRPEDVAALGRGGLGALQVMPGGFRHTATVETEGHETPKEAKDAFNRAYSASGAANQAALQADLDRSREEADAARSYADRLSAFQDQQARNEAERQQRMKKLEAEMDSALRENNSPGAVVGKAIGGLFASVGVAMGAYAATMTGQRNHALDAFNSFTEAELKRQKMEADRQDNFFARMRTRFGDERMAEEATRLGILEQFRSQSAQIAARAKGKDAEAKFYKLQEATEKERGDIVARMHLLADGQRQHTYQLTPPSLIGAGGAGGGGKLGGGLKVSPHVLNPFESKEHEGATLDAVIGNEKRKEQLLDNVRRVQNMDRYFGTDARKAAAKIDTALVRAIDAIPTRTASEREARQHALDALPREQREAFIAYDSFRNLRTRVLAGAAISNVEADIIARAQGATIEEFFQIWRDEIRPVMIQANNAQFASMSDASGARFKQATGLPGLLPLKGPVAVPGQEP